MTDAKAIYSILRESLDKGGLEAFFDRLLKTLEEEKKYPELFDAMLMRKRQALGLPLLGTENLRDLPEATQSEVEEYYVEVCRKIGGLFLEDGDIRAAWPYFRAIDEPKLVAAAIEAWQPPAEDDEDDDGEETDAVIDIALGQGAHPQRGFALVLSQYGVCRSITTFEHQFPHGPEVKEACCQLLVRRLYDDLLANLTYDVEQRGTEAEKKDIRSLLEKHPEVFDGHGYHIDISHLQSVVRFSATLDDKECLEKALQMTEYGRRLPRDFQSSDSPPFDDFYNDYRIFLQAMLGIGVDGAVRYFTQKADRAGIDEEGKHFPAEVLVHLLDRVGRHRAAIEAHKSYLKDVRAPLSAAPSLLELSERADDYSTLLEIAEDRDDVLQFAAGLIRSGGNKPADSEDGNAATGASTADSA